MMTSSLPLPSNSVSPLGASCFPWKRTHVCSIINILRPAIQYRLHLQSFTYNLAQEFHSKKLYLCHTAWPKQLFWNLGASLHDPLTPTFCMPIKTNTAWMTPGSVGNLDHGALHAFETKPWKIFPWTTIFQGEYLEGSMISDTLLSNEFT